MNSVSLGLILLTYKGKVLLMHKQNSVIDQEKHPWSLITVIKDKKKTFEKTLIDRVYKEMGIKIENVEFVSENYYHVRLTDNNVNSIKREENQLLDFFTLKELKKLYLTGETAKFIASHESLITL
jgi:hypothetical protein